MVAPILVLASASPRRRDLLRTIGVAAEVHPADVDETALAGEPATVYVERVAMAKAAAVAARIAGSAAVVLAADTTVELDGEILAKPGDEADARRMLRSLSGRTHRVHTAVVGRRAAGGGRLTVTATVTTEVTFARLTEQRIDWYLAIGEHADKAGAYGMQGAGGALVERIAGSPSNVVGLPLAETIAVLRACGLPIA